jgi:hypothetical protein
MGNHTPNADLMVGAPSRAQFWVDVKGLSSKSNWLVSKKAEHLNLFYILVFVSPLSTTNRPQDRFFILTQAEADELTAWYQPPPSAKWRTPGFNWTRAHQFEDKWEKLPL